mmetsp:Transcript_22421/g.36119  ORF Transcript_22421/g.36119 Transcript_22421/m.36119 type:complete len:313 (+) Transcript_22421:3021-3959(+)
MKFLALDTNMWSKLELASSNPHSNDEAYEVLSFLVEEVSSDRVTIPLFQTNIYETSKIDEFVARERVAKLQCLLSRGLVVKGLYLRLRDEFKQLLAAHFKLPVLDGPQDWFVSNYFWEAASMPSTDVSKLALDKVASHPESALLSYLCELDDEVRLEATCAFEHALAELLIRIEQRRESWLSETQSIRRRALSALLFLEHQDRIWEAVDELEIPTQKFKTEAPPLFRDLVRKVPSLLAERELTLVLEREERSLTKNDVRDMAFYTSALPYMNVVAGEHGFVNRARQAKLDTQFGTKLVSNLLEIPEAIGDSF